MAPLKLVKEQEVRQWWMATKTTELWNAMWAEDPCTLEPILPAVCQKKVFCFFCFSANEKPHFFKRLYELPQLQVAINDYITLP